MSLVYDPRNDKEVAYWNGHAGRSWVERQESQDAMLAPVAAIALERAAARPGEHVIDIGCGTGVTTIELGLRVGPTGRAVGIDVSEPMLARAAERVSPGAPVEFVRADATTHRFKAADFDLLFSRFGVMFFAEPARAFANLRGALRPGGRLTFACWRKNDENPWVMVPLRAAYEHVPPLPRPGPEDPGPFSFASEERVRRILGEAGFAGVAFEPHDFKADVAFGGGLEAAITFALDIGPTSRALEGQPPQARAAVAASMQRALAPYWDGNQVLLPAAIWVVTARCA